MDKLSGIKEEIFSYWPYYLVCIAAFYILPVIFSFPNAHEGFGFFIMNYLILLPLSCAIISFVFGKRHGFKLLFPIGIGCSFLFSKFYLEYMDDMFLQFSIAFCIISLMSCGFGSIFKKS